MRVTEEEEEEGMAGSTTRVDDSQTVERCQNRLPGKGAAGHGHLWEGRTT